jgi:hypothetical protein
MQAHRSYSSLRGKCMCTAHAMQADRAAAEAYGADAIISALRKVVLYLHVGYHSHFIMGYIAN